MTWDRGSRTTCAFGVIPHLGGKGFNPSAHRQLNPIEYLTSSAECIDVIYRGSGQRPADDPRFGWSSGYLTEHQAT